MSGRPVGDPVPGWSVASAPARTRLEGRFCVLEPVSPERHTATLFAACAADDAIWTYLPYGPYRDEAALHTRLAESAESADPLFFAVCDPVSGAALGVLSLMRITPAHGVIEIGHICFSPQLQRTPAASEAVILLIRWAFGAGYRRVEWKCDALNAASRHAAERYGFTFEGVFRQAMVVKGRNRDTAWYAIIDHDWPNLRVAYDAWLDPGNFDAEGRQRLSLTAERMRALAA